MNTNYENKQTDNSTNNPGRRQETTPALEQRMAMIDALLPNLPKLVKLGYTALQGHEPDAQTQTRLDASRELFEIIYKADPVQTLNGILGISALQAARIFGHGDLSRDLTKNIIENAARSTPDLQPKTLDRYDADHHVGTATKAFYGFTGEKLNDAQITQLKDGLEAILSLNISDAKISEGIIIGARKVASETKDGKPTVSKYLAAMLAFDK